MSKILVVDDDPDIRQLTATLVECSGYEALTAEDGETALALVTEVAVDAILLDITMPPLSGLAILDRLRGMPEHRHIPVILVSGRSDTACLVEGLLRGAVDYVTKPFSGAELMARVGAALRTGATISALERRNVELDRFALHASHDLKSPLVAIKGSVDILHDSWHRLTEAKRADLLDTAASSMGRAARMIDELLTLAHLDVPPQAIGRAETDAHGVVEEVVGAAALRPGDKAVVDGTWRPVTIARPELMAVMTNLVDNALHYGRATDGSLDAHIRGQAAPDRMVIDVADRGPGIPAESRRQVLEPFFALPGSRYANPLSSGIGLTIAARAVQRWGGAIDVLPTDPQGATFRVVLPST